MRALTPEQQAAIDRIYDLDLDERDVFPWVVPFGATPERQVKDVYAKRHAPFGYTAKRRGHRVSHVVKRVRVRFENQKASLYVRWLCGGESYNAVLTHQPPDHLEDCSKCAEAAALPSAVDQARVYFAQAPTTGAIKIGFTSDVHRRIRQIRPRVELLALMHGGRSWERQMHDRFAHLRIEGEWFQPADELINFIESLKTEAAS